MVKQLHRSGSKIYCVMSNNNPGISSLAEEVKLEKETNVEGVVQAASKWKVDIAVIGPEAPLGEGIVDRLLDAGVPSASPSKDASRIEISKSFMRNLMEKHGIPGRVAFGVFQNMDGVEDFLDEMDCRVAVKPVGLTGGKGVKIAGEHLDGKEEVMGYCREILSENIGGDAGFVLEEKLLGEEFTLQCFSDGKKVLPMPAVQDHKRAFEGDKGPNTGGMGSYSQQDHLLPFLKKEEYDKGVEILQKTVDAMRSEGSPYKGVLYGQFMLTKDGPRVVEFNARFGDPEAMNVLPLLKGSYAEICRGIAEGDLPDEEVDFAHLATVCKYVVPKGYGIESVSNMPLKVDEAFIEGCGAELFYASVDKRDDGLYTTTSRSLGIVGKAPELFEAESIAEEGLKGVEGTIAMRHDIGKKESVMKKVKNMEMIRGGM